MPEAKDIVINTGPLLALAAALGNLTFLSPLYRRILVPYEVSQEIRAGGPDRFGAVEFEEARTLLIWPRQLTIAPLLANSLDSGEAAVIQLALNENIRTVCIDERVGRRFAKLNRAA